MKDFHKAYLKNSDVDMKRLQKPRMEDCERMERRERDKLARQQIQNPSPEKSLFPAPVRISPSESDSRIESKLGDYSVAKKFISLDPTKQHTRVIGITTGAPVPAQRPIQQAPPPQQQLQTGLVASSTSSAATFSALPPPNNRNLPPPSSHHYHQAPPSHQSLAPQPGRGSNNSGTYIKQAENKQPIYNGRYPIQPVNKHEMMHPKSNNLGPPPMMPNGRINDKMPGSGITIQNGGGRFQVPSAPKQQKFPPDNSEPSLSVNGDVENILMEMTMRTNYTPLTEIAATPRKENENKFTFGQPNPHKYAELPPPFKPPINKQRERIVNVPKPTELERELENLSESDDERKKHTSVDRMSPTNDNSSESSESASSESGSEESNGGAKGETSNQTDKWHLSKYFLKPPASQPSPHDSNSQQMHEPNIKHETITPIDDENLSSSYRHNSNKIPPPSLDAKAEFNKLNSCGALELQPNQIKNECFDKSPSSSPEKIQHSDAVESDQIESVLKETQVLAEIKPVSEIGTSSEEEKKKTKRKKSPNKKPVKRRRKVQKDKKGGSDSSDEEDAFSSANTLSSDRSRSVDKEKKGRGRPRKNAAVLPVVTNKSPAIVTTPVKNSIPIKRERKPASRRNSRQSSTAISREFVATTSGTSSEDERATKKIKQILPPPAAIVTVKPSDSSRVLTQKPPSPDPTKSSDDDDDDDSSSSSHHSGEERLSSPADRGSSRQQYSTGHRSSPGSKNSSSSSSDDHSDSDSDDPREDKKIRDKTKSDKNKSDTLRKLFVCGPNRGEGGAKGKGQVLIVDQSEELQNQAKEVPSHHEKLLSPIAFKHSSDASNQINANSLKSPRTASTSISNNSSSNSLRTPERNLPCISPITTVNSKHQTINSSNANNSTIVNNRTSIICNIELSRLIHVPASWYHNSYSIRGSSHALTNNASNNNLITNHTVQSATSDDDRRKSPKLSVTSKNNNSNGKLNRNCSDNLLSNNNNNHSNSNTNVTSNFSNNSRLVNNDSIVGNQSTSRNVDGISKNNNDNTGGNNKIVNNTHNNLNYPFGLVNHNSNRDNTKESLEQSTNPTQSPKLEEQLLRNLPHANNQLSIKSASIKHEQIKSEFNDDYPSYPAIPASIVPVAIGGFPATTKSLSLADNKCNIYNSSKLSNNNNVKQEQLIKNEYKNSIVTNENQTLSAGQIIPISSNNASSSSIKSTSSDEHIPKSRRKRSSSSSSSPLKDRGKRKKGVQLQNEAIEQLPPTNHDRLAEKIILPPPPAQPVIQKIYKSYFERSNDDEFRLTDQENYLQEAKRLKHSADKETDHFNQVALYLTAVLYFLSSASCMELGDRLQSAFTIYKDTLSLIKFISSKFNMQSVQSNDNTSKVAILSLRCQSLISLKLYKLKRADSKEAQKTASHFFNKGTCEIINGNTPSISPSSVCSQGSGSNTPPLQMVPLQVHAAFQRQSVYFNYISSSHDLWDQADMLVKKGNHSDFFIDLDHANGPLTLHSSIYDLFKYVQSGLLKLKEM